MCALQAAMDGYQVERMEDVVATADIFVTATDCFEIITAEHMAAMKNKVDQKNEVYVLPKHLGEKVAPLHLTLLACGSPS